MPTIRYVHATAVRNIRPVGAVAIVILVSVLIAACSSSPGPDNPPPSSAPTGRDAPIGQVIFASNCAVCHGVGGEGQSDWQVRKEDGTLLPPPLNGDGHTWHHADGLLYRTVSQGGRIFEDPRDPSFKSAMPAFGDQLSHQEIVAVLTYIKSLWGSKTKQGLSIRESQASVSERDPLPSGGG